MESSLKVHRYIGEIGAEQLAWLRDDLGNLPAGTPIILIGHIPFVTYYDLLSNGPTTPLGRTIVLTDGRAFYRTISQHRVLGMLEGHIHVNELYRYKDVSFIDTGAVCGGWWSGPRDGHPEGFNLVHVYIDGIEAEYITYGWDASQYAS